MEIFVKDGEVRLENAVELFLRLGVSLRMPHPIPKPHFHFRAVECDLRMHEDTK